MPTTAARADNGIQVDDVGTAESRACRGWGTRRSADGSVGTGGKSVPTRVMLRPPQRRGPASSIRPPWARHRGPRHRGQASQAQASRTRHRGPGVADQASRARRRPSRRRVPDIAGPDIVGQTSRARHSRSRHRVPDIACQHRVPDIACQAPSITASWARASSTGRHARSAACGIQHTRPPASGTLSCGVSGERHLSCAGLASGPPASRKRGATTRGVPWPHHVVSMHARRTSP